MNLIKLVMRAVPIGINCFSGMLRTGMNVDVDVHIGMMVSRHLGDSARDMYNADRAACQSVPAAPE